MYNNVELSHIDGTYAPTPDDFHPMSGYRERSLREGEDYDALAFDRKMYAAIRTEKEELRKKDVELERCNKKAEEAQLLEDIRTAFLRSPKSFSISGVYFGKMDEISRRLDDKCKGVAASNSESGAVKKPISYLQSAVLKAFHETLRGTYKETTLFLSFLSHESSVVSSYQRLVSS